MDKGTILITGAAGFTGRHAASHFAARGYRVVGAVRSLQGLKGLNRQAGIHYAECDLTDFQAVQRLVDEADADYVLHLGGKNAVKESWEQPLLYMQSNVMGVFNVLEALRRRNSKARIVMANSRLRFELNDHPVPNHPYGLSKSLGGMAALCWSQLFGQELVIGEPSNLIGPGPSTGVCALLARHVVRAERGLNPPPFLLSSGQETRDFLDVRDAVRAYELLLLYGQNGEIYPLCSGRARSLRETADSFTALARVPAAVEEGGASRSVEPADSAAPTKLLQLGWQPLISWERSVGDILEFWRSQSF